MGDLHLRLAGHREGSPFGILSGIESPHCLHADPSLAIPWLFDLEQVVRWANNSITLTILWRLKKLYVCWQVLIQASQPAADSLSPAAGWVCLHAARSMSPHHRPNIHQARVWEMMETYHLCDCAQGTRLLSLLPGQRYHSWRVTLERKKMYPESRLEWREWGA